jgi:hypothetical protein
LINQQTAACDAKLAGRLRNSKHFHCGLELFRGQNPGAMRFIAGLRLSRARLAHFDHRNVQLLVVSGHVQHPLFIAICHLRMRLPNTGVPRLQCGSSFF